MEGSEFKDRAARGGEGWEGQNYGQEENPLDEDDNFYDENEDYYGDDFDDSFGSSDPNDSTSAVSTNPSQDTNNSKNRTDPTAIGGVRNQENTGAMQVNASDKDDKVQWNKYNMTQDVKSDNSILSDSINHGNDKSHLPTGIVQSNRSFQETNDFAKSMGITSDLSDNMFRQKGFSEAINTPRTSDKPRYPPYYMDSDKISRHGASNINSFNNQSHNNTTGVLEERMDESDSQQGVTDNVKSFSEGVTSDSVELDRVREENKDFQEEMDTEDQDLPPQMQEGAGEFPGSAGEFPEGSGEFPEGGEFPDDLIDDEGVTETPSESVGLPDELADAVLNEEVDKDGVDDADYEEEGSEEEESEESDDEDFNDAINAIGDLENEDFLNDEEGEVGLEEEAVDNQEVPDTSQSAEGTSEEPKKKRKRRKKGEAADEDGKKPKKKRKKKGEKSEDGEKKGDKNARRNIRKILTESNLEKETLDAQNAELERQRRLADLKKVMPTQVAAVVKPSPEKDTTKEKDSQLKSLLQAAEETAEKETDKKEAEKDKLKEEKKDVKTKKEGIIDISSGEEDEDCVMVRSEDEEEEDLSDEDYAEAEDVNNSGSHINDMYNVRDKEGRVLVNVGHPTSDPDIYLSPLVGQNIKPHQIGGVRFMYDNLVECINRFKTSNGFGCILAHSMGLGKTIQVVGFTDIFLRHTGARTVLVIVPINTLANWMAEFNMWVPDEQTCKQHENNLPPGMTGRPYPIYLLNDNFKNTPARAKVVDAWAKSGGVLLIGYEMYRLLSSKKVHLQKTNKGRKKTPESAVIDVEEEDRDRKLLAGVHEALVNPGPDLVVCDEGHRIKNSHAGISQSLKQIKTKRRIVLTGYPLQNNLIEYWCMVDFVRPNFLGTKTEFCNMFERPIMNGQCADSTPQDVRLMRYRAHVLHSLLEGFVQRRGHTVLQAALPPKEEYVFMIRMSPIQKQLYEKFMESITESGQNGWVNNNPLKAFSVCCKIWNHPDILYTILKKSLDDNDLDIETGEPKKKGRGRAKKETPPATPAPPTPSMDSDGSNSASNPGSGPPTLTPGIPVTVPGIPSTVVPNPGPSQGPTLSFGRYSEPNITYDWANEIMKDYVPGMLESGGKMVMLFKILQESLAVGDKILVFSQSLFTLNLVEDFLSKQKVPRYDTDEFWCKNKNYFRLDGSTSSTEREKLINQFNCDNTTWLFLLSTRAGSLGVNLIGANRVIVLDASWNPCHDCQAICRVYRFGQIKPSFIYRFVTENTMERKIYDRQVNKQGMSDRVVDELNPQSQFKKDHVEKLMVYADKEYEVQDFSKVEDEHFDPVMISTLKDQGHWLTCRPFTHESLLIDRKELKLTMKEKRLAKQSYVMEKRLNVSYSRPSYAAYYPKGQQPYQGGMRGRGMPARPIASVKPMISTPVPMKPKIVAAPQVLKPGVSVHQVLTTTDITLPGTNTTTEAGAVVPKKIPAGQNVLVIRTPKGVYIRTPDGKIFAVRSKPQPDSTSPLDTLANTGSTLALTATSGNSTTVTVVQAATNSTTSSTTTVRTPVTVIRPGGGVSANKPLTIIRQGPGPIRTVIPVTIGSKSGGAANASVTAKLMSQKVNTMIKNGTQIKIVNPSLLAGGKAGSTSSLTVGKKVIANSMSLSGGKVVSTTTASRPIAAVKTIDKDEAKMEVKPAPATMTTSDAGKKDEQKKQNDTDSSWNLPPIDMQALKIPKQLNEAGFQQSKNKDSVTSVVKSVQPSKPAVSGTQDGGPAKLSTRPSDIDLHELQLSNNPVTNTNTQIPNFQKSSQSAAMFTNTNTFMSQPPSYPGNQQGMMGQNNNNMPNNNNNMGSQQQMSGFTPDNTVSGQQQPVNTSTSINTSQPGTSNNFLQNQSSYGGMGDYSNQTGNQSNFNNMSNFTSNNQYGGNTNSMDTQNYGGFNSSFTGTGSQGYSNNSSDNNSDFNNIHNNSSFLSELNFTDSDDNFLAQLSGNDSTTQNQAAGQTSNMFMNNQNFSTGSTSGGSSSMSSGSGSMGGGSGSMGGGSGSVSMQGMQQSQPSQQQQQNMNYDNMYSSTQQNQGMFPRFGNNQFLGNQSFGNNQSFTQQGYPGGSMYPMGGMMQPAMYGYAPFAPYPYPPMMAPMPYYHPMPFQPQYGMQNNMGNTTIGASNMGNSNMAATNMGNASMGASSVGNPNMGNSSMGATNFDNKTNPLGGFTMNMGQGDNSFQQNQQTSNN